MEQFKVRGEKESGVYRFIFPEVVTLRDGDHVEEWLGFESDGTPVLYVTIVRQEVDDEKT